MCGCHSKLSDKWTETFWILTRPNQRTTNDPIHILIMFLRSCRYLRFVFVALHVCTAVSAFPISPRHRSLSREQISVISRSCRQHSVLTQKLSHLLCGRCRPVRSMELTSYLGLFNHLDLFNNSLRQERISHIQYLGTFWSPSLPTSSVPYKRPTTWPTLSRCGGDWENIYVDISFSNGTKNPGNDLVMRMSQFCAYDFLSSV